ncbi:MAG: hypothetical protein ACRDU8_04655, partial [Egibacteraceae bacterium]
PSWAIAIARGNVRADRLDDLLLPGRTVSPEEAVEAGFADAAVAGEQVLPVAAARAAELASLPRVTYAETKRRLRADLAEHAAAVMETDVRGLLAARA